MTPQELAERGIRVRKLEWKYSSQYNWWRADPAITGNCYIVCEDGGAWLMGHRMGATSPHPSMEAAKAAAEADYTARIAAQLEGMKVAAFDRDFGGNVIASAPCTPPPPKPRR